MITFTNQKTIEALADDRWQTGRLPLRGLKIHPRDWFESWGHSEPALWTIRPLIGKKTTWRLYPHYTKDYGWEWISSERFKVIYGERRTN